MLPENSVGLYVKIGALHVDGAARAVHIHTPAGFDDLRRAVETVGANIAFRISRTIPASRCASSPTGRRPAGSP